jgi:hypothetical protein
MKLKHATIISYCTNDFRFIDRCIVEARKFSSEILVVACDHFFDGTSENRVLLEHTYSRHPDCQFIEFSYLSDRLYSPYHAISPESDQWAIFWAATTRYIGFHYLSSDIDTVLFLDSDEIVEGESFQKWFESGAFRGYAACRLASYLYAVRSDLQAKKVVNLPLLVRKKSFTPLTLINELERIGAYRSHPGPKRERIVGIEGKPMVHHYSWVRTKEECYQKTKTWGHRHDANWSKLIEEAFSGKRDRIFDSEHEFVEIETPYFDPLKVAVPTIALNGKWSNVLKIDDRDVRRKELDAFF